MTEENYCYEKIPHVELLQNYLIIDNIDLCLIHETQNYVNKKISEVIKQKFIIRAPYDKKILVGKAKCYNENANC